VIGGAESERDAGVYRVLIRPNQALSPSAIVYVVAGFAILSLSIGIAFAARGMWLVLPFAGLEVALFAIAFWSVTRSARDYDLVCVDNPHVTLYQCRMGNETSYRFQRAWVKVQLENN